MGEEKKELNNLYVDQKRTKEQNYREVDEKRGVTQWVKDEGLENRGDDRRMLESRRLGKNRWAEEGKEVWLKGWKP